VTDVRIVDASALGALLFGEPDGPSVTAALRRRRLVAPVLLGFELASVCLKKIRQYPERGPSLLEALTMWEEMGIEILPVDQVAVVSLAERSGLTSYDASYLWLTQRLNAELVTLDRRLARAAVSLRPS
jgi:predicted nucleic acid-binding protein